MAEYYVGQIMLTGFGFAQKNFAQCNGQLLSIPQNQALFALLGTYYGGNGTTNFQLPDLRGRAPVGALRNYPIGLSGGVENVTLTLDQLSTHSHLFDATTQSGGTTNSAGALYCAATTSSGAPLPIYADPSTGNLVPLNAQEVSQVGGNRPHSNIQPVLAINFNIAMSGSWPSRN
jgi:microcystin-dependent protein